MPKAREFFLETARRRRAKIFGISKLYFQEFCEIWEIFEILSKVASSNFSRRVKLRAACYYFQDDHGRVYQKIKVGLPHLRREGRLQGGHAALPGRPSGRRGRHREEEGARGPALTAAR